VVGKLVVGARRSRLAEVWQGYAALDRRIWAMAAARGISTMGLSLVMAFMAIYLVEDRGVSGTATGVIYVIANLCQALSHGWAGDLSDRVGRRGLMMAALVARAAVLAAIGGLVLVAAPVALISVALVAGWTLRGAFEPVAYAVVADVAPPDQRVAAFGLQRVGTNAGWALGPAIGGLLRHSLSYGAVFFCAVPVVLAAVVLVQRMSEPPRRPSGAEPPRSLAAAIALIRTRPVIALFLGCALASALVAQQLFTTFSLYTSAIGIPKDRLGLLWMINGSLVMALQLPAVAVIARIGSGRSLVIGTALHAVAFLAIGAARDFGQLACAIAILTVGEVIHAPAEQTTAAELADPARMGRAFGSLGTFRMLGVAFAPLLGGVAFDHLRHEPLAMWGALGSVAVMTAIGYAVLAGVRSAAARPSES
jgi:predicted MFS family arabinose efflux permease